MKRHAQQMMVVRRQDVCDDWRRGDPHSHTCDQDLYHVDWVREYNMYHRVARKLVHG